MLIKLGDLGLLEEIIKGTETLVARVATYIMFNPVKTFGGVLNSRVKIRAIVFHSNAKRESSEWLSQGRDIETKDCNEYGPVR